MMRALIQWLIAMLVLYLVWIGFGRFVPHVDTNIEWSVGTVLLLFALTVTADFLLSAFGGGGFIRWPRKNTPPS